MKKTIRYILTGALTAALVFGFAACGSDDDDDDKSDSTKNSDQLPADSSTNGSGDTGNGGGTESSVQLPASSGTNELSGSSFTATSDHKGKPNTIKYSFGDSSLTFVQTETEAATEYYDAFDEKITLTGSYTYDSALKVLYLVETGAKMTYERNGKLLYTEVQSPATFAAYKQNKLDMMKAVAKDASVVTDDKFVSFFGEDVYDDFKHFGYTDTTGATAVSDEIYAKWLTYQKKEDAAESAEIDIKCYSLDGTTLKMTTLEAAYPSGTKFAKIFSSYSIETYLTSGNTERLKVSTHTRTGEKGEIKLTDVEYKILSATDDKVTLAPITGKDADDLYGIYNEAQKSDVALTYTDGMDKTTVSFTIGETAYSFDINYITAAVVTAALSDADSYTKVTE